MGAGGPLCDVIKESFLDLAILRCLYHIPDGILNRVFGMNLELRKRGRQVHLGVIRVDQWFPALTGDSWGVWGGEDSSLAGAPQELCPTDGSR